MKKEKGKTHKEKRLLAHQELGKYGSLKVTWKKFDCGLSDDGLQNACTKCVICKYNDFREYAGTVGLPEGSTVEYDKFKDNYSKIVYER